MTTIKWDDLLEKSKEISIEQKNTIENELGRIYNDYKMKIEDTDSLKNDIITAMSQGQNFMYFYDSYRYRSSIIREVFETQKYGKEILIELLRKQLPEPITVNAYVASSIVFENYRIELRWGQQETICNII